MRAKIEFFNNEGKKIAEYWVDLSLGKLSVSFPHALIEGETAYDGFVIEPMATLANKKTSYTQNT